MFWQKSGLHSDLAQKLSLVLIIYNFDLVELPFNYLICRLVVSYGQPLVSRRQPKPASTIQHWCLHRALELGHSVPQRKTMNQLQTQTVACRVRATKSVSRTNIHG